MLLPRSWSVSFMEPYFPCFHAGPFSLRGSGTHILEGLLYGTLEAVSPGMNQRIDWLWFVISQMPSDW